MANLKISMKLMSSRPQQRGGEGSHLAAGTQLWSLEGFPSLRNAVEK